MFLIRTDGRKEFPINHGVSSPDTVLEDAVVVVRGFMDRQPGELRFTMVALCEGQSEEEGEQGMDTASMEAETLKEDEEVMVEVEGNNVD
jgi:hypothetical protein